MKLFRFAFHIAPAGAYGYIHLCGIPYQFIILLNEFPASDIHPCGIGNLINLPPVSGITFRSHNYPGNYAPFLFPAHPCFVSNPSHVRAADTDTGFRLQSSDYIIIAIPIIVLKFIF